MNIISTLIHPRTVTLILWAVGIIIAISVSVTLISAATAAVGDAGFDGGGGISEVDGSYLERGLVGEDAAEAAAVRDILGL